MKKMKSVCVYCGHNTGNHVYEKAAADLGKALAEANLELVYGGGKLGLMGVIADNILAHGGRAVGFIPHHLDAFEGAHTGIQELHRVNSMHTRKLNMANRADAFVILPGGFGTLDEFFEIITWKQLQLHDKPIIIVNINNYWDTLEKLMHHVIYNNFALPEHRLIFKVVSTVKEVIPTLRAEHDPQVEFASHLV